MTCLFGVIASASVSPLQNGLAEASAVLDGVEEESDWVLLRVKNARENDAHGVIVAPPPGAYPFRRGDQIVLHAFDGKHRPIAVRWTGDASALGASLHLELHADMTIGILREDNFTTAATVATPWYDVPKDAAIHAFLGGGNLYGWFSAKRDKDHGAGIAQLTRSDTDALTAPLYHGVGLNLEHIFSGAKIDQRRSYYTPRTDPMRFRIESPGAVTVHWPAETAAWKMDNTLRYTFAGGDALDLEFQTTPGDEDFPLDHVVFMWATYHNRSKDRALYFPGLRNDETGWMRFGPVETEGTPGGAIASRNARTLTVRPEVANINLLTSDELFFTKPVYYGKIDDAVNTEKHGQAENVIMMFDQDKPIRFVLWNWGTPPAISAWDWQYALLTPRPGERAGYNARMAYTPDEGRDAVLRRYREWREAVQKSPREPFETPARTPFPESPFYWSPAVNFLDVFSIGPFLEAYDPEQALALYRLALFIYPEIGGIAEAIDRVYGHQNDVEGRIEEWRALKTFTALRETPYLQLGNAYYDAGDFPNARGVLTTGIDKHPSAAGLPLLLGRVLLEEDAPEAALAMLRRAASLDPQVSASAGFFAAKRARAALDAADFSLAEQLYRAAAALASDDLWHLVHRGESLEMLDREEEALELYRQVLRIKPDSPYTAAKLDALHENLQLQEQRLAFWQSLHQQHPDAPVPALRLGQALHDAGRIEEAAALFETLLAAFPDHSEALLRVGWMQVLSGRADEGLSRVSRALEQDASLAAFAARAHADAADQALASARYNQAEAWLRQAVRLAPEDHSYRYRLAETLEAAGDYKDALAEFLHIVLHAPEAAHSAARADAILLAQDDAMARLEVWRRLAEGQPDNPSAQHYFRKALDALGNQKPTPTSCPVDTEQHPQHEEETHP